MIAWKLSEHAMVDLEEIWDHIALDAGPDTADRIAEEFSDAIARLAKHPGIGHRHAHLTDSRVRVWIVHSYLIIYWPEDVPLGIARVVHGHRDMSAIETPRP